MKKVVLALAAVPVLFWLVWMSFSAGTLRTIIEDSVPEGPLRIEVRGLKKGFFYTVDIDRITLKIRQNEFVSFDTIYGRVNPFDLLLLRLDLAVRGHIRDGNISGQVAFTKSSITGDVDFAAIHLSDLQFLKSAGINGTGTLDGSFILRGSSGHLDFAVKDANFEPADFSGVRVPLNFFQTVSGALDIQGNTVQIAALSLEGRDLYARLKGTVRDAVMDMTMEFMPGKTYAENPLLLAGLGPYEVSPGYYVIPVKRSLRNIF